MKFALLIYGQNEPYEALTEDESTQMYAGHGEFIAMLRERNALHGGEELRFVAKTVRPQDGDFVVTDGPYAESAEHLGGLYLVEADDIEQAAEYAKHIPMLPTDGIEVRPVM